jgi:hypothetical protein
LALLAGDGHGGLTWRDSDILFPGGAVRFSYPEDFALDENPGAGFIRFYKKELNAVMEESLYLKLIGGDLPSAYSSRDGRGGWDHEALGDYWDSLAPLLDSPAYAVRYLSRGLDRDWPYAKAYLEGEIPRGDGAAKTWDHVYLVPKERYIFVWGCGFTKTIEEPQEYYESGLLASEYYVSVCARSFSSFAVE